MIPVTLACIETRSHALMRLTLQDALRKTDFQQVLLMTDKPDIFGGIVRTLEIADAPTKLDWEKQRWYNLPQQITTSHVLFMEWDAGICDPEMWSDEFLKYDYIGAPWWYKDGKNVGNGGFSLKSSRLSKFLARSERFVCREPGDQVLCRDYRSSLEAEGFIWAPEDIAHRFSFECSPPHRTFGFHAMRNWPVVLDIADLQRRGNLAANCPYIQKTDMMGQLRQAAPYLAFN